MRTYGLAADRPRLATFFPTVSLAFPMVLARLLELLVPTIDLIAVGTKDSQQLAYLGLGWAPWALCYVIATGFISSASVLFSQAATKSDQGVLGKIFHSGALLAVFCGLVIFLMSKASAFLFLTMGFDSDLAAGASAAFQGYSYCMPLFLLQVHIAHYFGAKRRPWPEVAAMAVAVASNILLNHLSVTWTGHVSATGIAVATSLARCLGALFLIGFLALDQSSKFCRLHRFAVDWSMIRKHALLGCPLAFSFGLESATYFVMALIAAKLGEADVAGFQAAMNTLNLIYMVTMGIGLAAGVQTGRAVGAGNMNRVRSETFAFCAIGFVAMALISSFLLAWSDNIARLYARDPHVLRTISSGLLICAIYLPFESMQIILKIAMRGLGDVWIPLLNVILAFWVVGVPMAWILALKAGLSTDGLFISIGAAMISAFVLNILRFRSLCSSNIEALI